jgi:hypothetical protein
VKSGFDGAAFFVRCKVITQADAAFDFLQINAGIKL